MPDARVIIPQDDDLVIRPGAKLDDADMTVYNAKTKVSTKPDWLARDRTLSRIESPLRQKAGSWEVYKDHIIPELTPIGNQGPIGSCVANAWCDDLEILDGLDGTDRVEQLSRRFLYYISRALHGATAEDNGTFIRAAAHQLRKIGIFEEKFWEYSFEEADHVGQGAAPEADLYMMAADNRLEGFYKISSLDESTRLREMELAIRANHPIVFGVPVNRDFTRYRGDGTIWMPPTEDIVGNHAMIVTGVMFDGETRHWLWRNSWSKRWGTDGHCKVSDQYMLEAEDIWVGTRMKELI